MKLVIAFLPLLALGGCSGMDYKPVQERSFAQLASNGCGEEGEQMLVEGYVSRAYQNTVVLWDGIDPQATTAITLPGRGWLARARGWFGDSKHEVSEQELNQLAAARIPVTFGVECQGRGVAPEARSIRYTNAQGQRVAIAY